MPFTLAHPAAVLPLRRLKYLQTVPLIVGSITPDLPYFIPALPGRLGRWAAETHTLFGSVAICIPLGMALLLFLFLLRSPVTALMSARAQWLCLRSMEGLRQRPLLWAMAPLSMLIGIWTHLVWDSLTHGDGWMVRRIDALSMPVNIGWYSGELCHVLQYVSSALGLLVLAIWYRRLPSPPPQATSVERPSVVILLLLVLVAAMTVGVYQAVLHAPRNATYYVMFYRLLTRTIAWFAFFYTMASVLVSFNRRTVVPAATP